MKHHSANERGSALLAVLMLASLILVITGSMAAIFLKDLRGQQRLNINEAAEMIKLTVSNTIGNDQAWLRTMQSQPAAFSCLLTSGATCANAMSGPISVMYANGAALVGSAASDGLSLIVDTTATEPVALCSSFDSGTGDDNCMFKFEITWRPVCPASGCPPTVLGGPQNMPLQPEVEVFGTFKFRPRSSEFQSVIRSDRFNFSFVRARMGGSVSSYCRSLGGVFDQIKEKCVLLKDNPTAAVQGACPEGFSQYGTTGSGTPICMPRFACRPFYYLAGFQLDGTPICNPTPMLNAICPQNTAVVGINSLGEFICGSF